MILTHKRLLEVLEYNPETGIFTWIKSTGPRCKVGAEAGNINPEGYRAIQLDNISYLTHRLAWFYCFEEWPEQEIDHINRNKLDNSLDNLVDSSNQKNSENKGNYANNSSGFKGVYAKRGKWEASIKHKGKTYYIGLFNSPEEARQAYLDYRKDLIQ